MEQGTHKSWLASCPCGDGNFKSRLAQASAKDIAEVIDEATEKTSKSKITALKRELRKRQYEVNTVLNEDGEMKTSNTFHDYYAALEFYNSIEDELKEFCEVNEDGYILDVIEMNY